MRLTTRTGHDNGAPVVHGGENLNSPGRAEISGLTLDLVDHGLRIVDEYRLLNQHIISHTRITEMIEFGSLSVDESHGYGDGWQRSSFVLFQESRSLIEVLFPTSIWRLCYSIVTGRCRYDGGPTRDILDRWALNSMDHEGKNYWDSTIKCAKDLLVDAGGVIPGVNRNHTGVGNVVGVVDEVSLAAVVMPILSTTELLAAVRDT